MDDGDMTNEEFEEGIASGQPAEVVSSRTEFDARNRSAIAWIVTGSSNVGCDSLIFIRPPATVVRSISGDLVDA